MKVKKSKWLVIMMVLAMLLALVPAVGGAVENGNDNGCGECGPLEVRLLAGQNIDVGSVSVENDGDKVCVTYALDQWAIDAGWGIYETHLYIGTTDAFPLTSANTRLGGPYNANPIPGQFPYGDDELDGVEYYEECIDIPDGWDWCDELYIAAHAVVKRFAEHGDATSAVIYGNIGGYEPGKEGQGDIWEIDPIGQTETKIFNSPSLNFEADWYPNALAYDEDNHRLYFATTRNTLFFYDFSSGNEITALTDASGDFFTNSNNVLGATFGDGSFWYILNQSGKLYQVDFDGDGIATGRTEYVMTEKSLTQGDIVYEDGIIYGSSGTGASPAGGFRGFFSYDIDNNDFNVIYETTSTFAAPQLAWGLDEDGDKVMYGCRGIRVDGVVVGSEWYTVDLESGEDTPIDYITDNAYQDLASKFTYEEIWEDETAWGEGYRFNERSNWGMYFKYKICEPLAEKVIFPESGTTTVAFEDQKVDASDWDYNDWVVAIDTEGTFEIIAGKRYLTSIEFDITPKARGAVNRHRFHLVIPAGTFSSDGTYTLVILDDNGEEVSSATDTFNASEEKDFRIWENTASALPNLSNTDPDKTKLDPLQTAKLSIVFDDDGLNEFDFDDYSEIGIHGAGLFFEPYLFNFSTDQNFKIPVGDIRMLVVPEDWRWPTERTPIWNAYDAVGVDAGLPTFVDGWWELSFDENLVY